MKEYLVELRAKRFGFSLLPRKFSVEAITHSPTDAKMFAIGAVMEKGYAEKRIEIINCKTTGRKVTTKNVAYADYQEYVAE